MLSTQGVSEENDKIPMEPFFIIFFFPNIKNLRSITPYPTVLNILYNPAKHANKVYRQLQPHHIAILDLIQKMLLPKPTDRPNLAKVLEKVESFSRGNITSRITLQEMQLKFDKSFGKMHIGNCRTAARSGNAYFHEYKIHSSSLTQEFFHTGISIEVHDQKESSLCWSFALATMLAAEIKRYIKMMVSDRVLKSAIWKQNSKLSARNFPHFEFLTNFGYF